MGETLIKIFLSYLILSYLLAELLVGTYPHHQTVLFWSLGTKLNKVIWGRTEELKSYPQLAIFQNGGLGGSLNCSVPCTCIVNS